jgi:hypothetical protein
VNQLWKVSWAEIKKEKPYHLKGNDWNHLSFQYKEKTLSPIKKKNALDILNFSYHLSYHQIQTIRKSQ